MPVKKEITGWQPGPVVAIEHNFPDSLPLSNLADIRWVGMFVHAIFIIKLILFFLAFVLSFKGKFLPINPSDDIDLPPVSWEQHPPENSNSSSAATPSALPAVSPAVQTSVQIPAQPPNSYSNPTAESEVAPLNHARTFDASAPNDLSSRSVEIPIIFDPSPVQFPIILDSSTIPTPLTGETIVVPDPPRSVEKPVVNASTECMWSEASLEKREGQGRI